MSENDNRHEDDEAVYRALSDVRRREILDLIRTRPMRL